MLKTVPSLTALAPEGPRDVATGATQSGVSRAKWNPWITKRPNTRPGGCDGGQCSLGSAIPPPASEGLFVLRELVEHDFSVLLDRMKKSIGHDLQD